VHVHQVNDVPLMRMNVDRTRASQMGLKQADVANDMLMSLSFQRPGVAQLVGESGQQRGLPGRRADPAYKVDSEEALMNTPVHTGNGTSQLLGNLAKMERGHTASVVNHYNVQPVYDVYANVQDRDLGTVAGDVAKCRQHEIEAAQGQLFRNARPGGHHAGVFHRHGLRHGVRHSAGLLPDGGEFPIVAGSVHYSDGAARRAGGILLMLFFTQTTSVCRR
jgi:hypothetical protein